MSMCQTEVFTRSPMCLGRWNIFLFVCNFCCGFTEIIDKSGIPQGLMVEQLWIRLLVSAKECITLELCVKCHDTDISRARAECSTIILKFVSVIWRGRLHPWLRMCLKEYICPQRPPCPQYTLLLKSTGIHKIYSEMIWILCVLLTCCQLIISEHVSSWKSVL